MMFATFKLRYLRNSVFANHLLIFCNNILEAIWNIFEAQLSINIEFI